MIMFSQWQIWDFGKGRPSRGELSFFPFPTVPSIFSAILVPFPYPLSSVSLILFSRFFPSLFPAFFLPILAAKQPQNPTRVREIVVDFSDGFRARVRPQRHFCDTFERMKHACLLQLYGVVLWGQKYCNLLKIARRRSFV